MQVNTASPVQNTFIHTAQATVVWRPLRLAYLIRAAKPQDVLDAITYACSEVGGYSHPMLPIDGARRVQKNDLIIARILKPDFLVNFAGVDHVTVGRIADSIGAQPTFGRDVQYGLHPLALTSVDQLRARTLMVPKRPSNLAEAVALGLVAPNQATDWAACVGRVQPAENWIDVLDGQLEAPSPVGVTRSGVDTVQHSGLFGAPVIVDTRPITFRRAVRFWNLRATALPGWRGLAARLIWLTDRALDDPQVGDRLREACLSTRTDPDLVLNGPDPAHLHAVAQRLGFVESPGPGTSANFDFSNPARDLTERPLRYRVNAHPLNWLLGERTWGSSRPIVVPVTKPKMIFTAEMALRCRAGTGGYLRASVTGIEELRWPRRASVARLVEPNATWHDDQLGVVVSTAPSFTFNLGVPDPSEVVSAIIGERGWRWELSDKGRYAQSLGSAAGLHVMSLASAEVTDLVMALATLNSRKAAQILKQLAAPERDLERMQVMERLLTRSARWRTLGEVVGDIPNQTKHKLLPLVDRLLEAGLLRRAYRMECQNCRIPFHLELSRADDIVPCPGCMTKQVLVGPNGSEPVFAYALNSLLDRAVDQDCLSHLLAELWARQSLGVLWAIPGANVVQADGRGREIDLLAITRDALILGELKARSTAFTRSYVRGLADLARDLNGDVLLLGSLDAWPAERRADVAKWAGPTLRTIVVTRTDLLRTEETSGSVATQSERVKSHRYGLE